MNFNWTEKQSDGLYVIVIDLKCLFYFVNISKYYQKSLDKK